MHHLRVTPTVKPGHIYSL